MKINVVKETFLCVCAIMHFILCDFKKCSHSSAAAQAPANTQREAQEIELEMDGDHSSYSRKNTVENVSPFQGLQQAAI